MSELSLIDVSLLYEFEYDSNSELLLNNLFVLMTWVELDLVSS